jgi:hypothetical protein
VFPGKIVVCSRRARAVLLLAAAGITACRGREAAPAASERSGAPPLATPSPTLAAPDSRRLVGRWMRTDSEYTIWIGGASPEGRLDARYLNPQPINVSRAEWKREDGRITLLVELRDRGYPGSYYTLTYDAANDGLHGVYHHLGLGQDFDVTFYRVEAAPPR